LNYGFPQQFLTSLRSGKTEVYKVISGSTYDESLILIFLNTIISLKKLLYKDNISLSLKIFSFKIFT